MQVELKTRKIRSEVPSRNEAKNTKAYALGNGSTRIRHAGSVFCAWSGMTLCSLFGSSAVMGYCVAN
jgi:hypothetical protein